MLRALTSEPTKTMKGMQLKTKIVTNNILPYRTTQDIKQLHNL
jgi:hypothetical protein